MEKKVLDVQVGTKGVIKFYDTQGFGTTQKAHVIAIYKSHNGDTRFAVLVEYRNFGSIVDNFNEYGFVQNGERVLFKFEVTE